MSFSVNFKVYSEHNRDSGVKSHIMPPKGSGRAAQLLQQQQQQQQQQNDGAWTSESDSRQVGASSNSRASTKARNAAAQAAQAAQAELLAKHINSNGPKEKEIVNPLDFETLPDQSLRAYRELYGAGAIPAQNSLTQEGYLLGSDIGKKTYSYKTRDRVSKAELAKDVKKHFLSQYVKESDAITNFIYKVNNQDKAFKLKLKDNK